MNSSQPHNQAHANSNHGTVAIPTEPAAWYRTGPGEDPDRSSAMRTTTTTALLQLLQHLQPYIDGTFGTVSPRHTASYIQAIKELNRLWNATYTPEPELGEDEGAGAELERATATRARVLDQIRGLRERTVA